MESRATSQVAFPLVTGLFFNGLFFNAIWLVVKRVFTMLRAANLDQLEENNLRLDDMEDDTNMDATDIEEQDYDSKTFLEKSMEISN